jgi:hypothetical protein
MPMLPALHMAWLLLLSAMPSNPDITRESGWIEELLLHV